MMVRGHGVPSNAFYQRDTTPSPRIVSYLSNDEPTNEHDPSCRSLRHGLANGISPCLLGEHDAEPLEIVDRPPLRDSLPLLRPGRLLPLLDRAVLLEVLADDTGASAAGKRREDEGRKGQVAVGECLAGNASGGPVNDSLQDVTTSACRDMSLPRPYAPGCGQ